MKQFPEYIMPDAQSGIFYNRICLKQTGEASKGSRGHDCRGGGNGCHGGYGDCHNSRRHLYEA